MNKQKTKIFIVYIKQVYLQYKSIKQVYSWNKSAENKDIYSVNKTRIFIVYNKTGYFLVNDMQIPSHPKVAKLEFVTKNMRNVLKPMKFFSFDYCDFFFVDSVLKILRKFRTISP